MTFLHKTFKAYQQLEHSDCGITCIRMICRYYGKDITLRQLRSMCDVSRLGISMNDIVSCLRTLQFEVAAVKVTAEEVWRMPLPAILFWNQNHFVVLYKMDSKRRRFHVADPAYGKVSFSEADFMKHWQGSCSTGLAAVMDPAEGFVKEKGRKYLVNPGLMKFVASNVRKFRPSFLKVTLLTLLTIAADACMPLLFQQTVDSGIARKDIPLIWLLIGSQFLMFAGQYAANCVSHIINVKIGLGMHLHLTAHYLSRLIRKPIVFFDRKVNADLIQKLDDLNRIRQFLVSLPATVFLTLTNIVVFSALLVYYSAGVFCLFLLASLFSFLWTRLFLQHRKELDYAYTSYAADNRNQIYELVHGMTEVRVNHAQEHRVEKWNENQTRLNSLSLRAAFVNLYISCGNTFADRVKDILITGICASLVVKGQMSMGAMMTVSYLCGRLSSPFNELVGMARTVQDAEMSYERLDEVLNEKAELPKECLQAPVGKPVDIRLENVSFKYPGSRSPMVLQQVSLHIPQGTTIALVGESGCGKTSLMKLLMGFYPPTEGHILVNGTPLAEVSTDEWLTHCGAVLQNGYIFSGSILENIALADKEPDLVRAKEAASMACMDEFFCSLPMGYHTKIGSNGLELSGGQKQRLLIARAVYKRPSVLFLDEATSSLDANNEKRIVHHLSSFCQGRTVIIAAHRLSTIRHADLIAFFEKGEPIEMGTHDELINKRGKYYGLVCSQMG